MSIYGLLKVDSTHVMTIGLTAPSGASAFDYYLSPTGDDNNAGTLGNPWSITALNSKGSTYAGKRVGMLPGTYQYGTVGGVQTTIYSILNGEGVGKAALNLNGGSISASTYLGSSNSSGLYSPRTAVIDASNPSGGARSTNTDAIVLGQAWYGGNPPANAGYVTIDGIVIKTFTFAAIGLGDIQVTILNGVLIQNCELYDGLTISNNNPGAIFLGTTQGAQILNCKLHDLGTTNAGSYYPYGQNAIMTYSSNGLVVLNCSLYKCAAFQMKDHLQDCTVSYCYLDSGSFGDLGAGGNYWYCICGVPGSGKTATYHHNIILGTFRGWGLDGTTYTGNLAIYNNTFYPGGSANGPFYMEPGSGGTLHSYNNLFYAKTSFSSFPAAIAIQGANGTNTPQCDFNAYGPGANFAASVSIGGGSLASWQALGFDTHSTSLASTPFSSTPSAVNMNSFAITGPATTAGIGGVACGAIDGSGTVGCNF